MCERYPYDLPIYNVDFHTEVDEATYHQTLGCDNYHAWRVVDDKLSHERYEPTPEHEIIQELRDLRAEICFPVINRGQAWYNCLTAKQKDELAKWYNDWLDAPKTKTEPSAPAWLFACKGGKDL